MTLSTRRVVVISAASLSIAAAALLAPRAPRLVAEDRQNAQTVNRELPLSLDAKLLEIKPGDDELRRLLVERFNAAAEEWRYAQAAAEFGRLQAEAVIGAARRVGVAAIALTDSKAEQIRIREELVKIAERVEGDQKQRIDAGVGDPIELQRARYARIEAQIDLVLAKRAAGK